MLDDKPAGALVPRSTITDICAARERALVKIAEAAATIAAGHALTDEADKIAEAAHRGALGYKERGAKDGPLSRDGFDPEAAVTSFRRRLDIGIWTHLIDYSGMSDLMDKTAKDELRKSLMGDVPEATEANVAATLETMFADAGIIFARGLAVAFSKLDRRFRSHDGFKIGSRMVLTRCFDDWGSWNYYARHDDTLTDIERVFAKLDGGVPNPGGMKAAIDRSRGRGLDPRQSECETAYFRVKGFKNGNAHVWFTRDDLVEKANRVLADYYGAAIGDAVPKEAGHDFDRDRGTALARDLQFFATPPAVTEALLDRLELAGKRVLEPSAGEGGIARELLRKGASVFAVEVHPGRAETLRRLPGKIVTLERNFLCLPATPNFDFVLMNPPFAGTHWMDHVTHAFGFLAPGGLLRAVLPASAEVNESPKHDAFRKWATERATDRGWRMFDPLPAESFASSGTRVQTVILKLRAKR